MCTAANSKSSWFSELFEILKVRRRHFSICPREQRIASTAAESGLYDSEVYFSGSRFSFQLCCMITKIFMFIPLFNACYLNTGTISMQIEQKRNIPKCHLVSAYLSKDLFSLFRRVIASLFLVFSRKMKQIYKSVTNSATFQVTYTA